MSGLPALWVSIILGAIAQISLKSAVSRGLTAANPLALTWWFSLLRSGWLWLYAISFTVATVLWLLALSGLNISYAFPLLSAGYILVAFLARIVLKEAVCWKRWLGIAIICIGVLVIAWS